MVGNIFKWSAWVGAEWAQNELSRLELLMWKTINQQASLANEQRRRTLFNGVHFNRLLGALMLKQFCLIERQIDDQDGFACLLVF